MYQNVDITMVETEDVFEWTSGSADQVQRHTIRENVQIVPT